MVLETALEPKAVNIRNLTVEVPRVENRDSPYFDPGVWDFVKAWVEQVKRGSYYDLLQTGADVKMAFPEKFDELGLTGEAVQGLIAVINTRKLASHWEDYADLAADFKVVFPEDFVKLELQTSPPGSRLLVLPKQSPYQEVKNLLRWETREDRRYNFRILYYLAVIAPEKRSDYLTRAGWEEVERRADLSLETFTSRPTNNPREVAEDFAIARIISPEKWQSIRPRENTFLQLEEQRLKLLEKVATAPDTRTGGGKGSAPQTKQEFALAYLSYAAHLMVITARDVRVDDQGIHLVHDEPKIMVTADPTPLPEIKEK